MRRNVVVCRRPEPAQGMGCSTRRCGEINACSVVCLHGVLGIRKEAYIPRYEEVWIVERGPRAGELHRFIREKRREGRRSSEPWLEVQNSGKLHEAERGVLASLPLNLRLGSGRTFRRYSSCILRIRCAPVRGSTESLTAQ